MSYNAIICTLGPIRKHSNADKLNLTTIYGNQVVIGLDAKEGDIGIFFPTDGQLSEEYCKAHDLIGYTDPETNEKKGGYFGKNRRVRAQRFRGEKSEGFFMPISSLEFTGYDISKLKDGDQFSNLNEIEICRKYVAPSTRSQGSGKHNRTKKLKHHYLMFKEHIDTSQFAYNVNGICKYNKSGLVIITEKLHGTSGRTGYLKVVTDFPKWKYKLSKIIPIFKKKEEWQTITGTRKVILDDFNDPNKQGYYHSNDFRKIWHDQLQNQLRKGETIYYEIVGYVNEDTTIMPSCENKKLKDKQFIKQYGPITTFKYGCISGQCDIYVYRITMTNEDGYTVEYPWKAMTDRCDELGIKYVPLLTEPFILDHSPESLKLMVENYYEGPSTLDPSHIREGVVVRIDNGNNFIAFKHKNFEFKVLEDIIKESNQVDIEEAQDFINIGE